MHKISENLKKWQMNTSVLSAEDLEVIEIVKFPKILGYRDTAQKRIKRMYANGGYVDKQSTDINDIVYTVVGKHTAKHEIAKHTPQGDDSATLKASIEHMAGVMKSKAKKHVYFDANFIEEELEWLLSTYSKPKPTPSMAKVEKTEKVIVETKKEEPKKTRTRTKVELTDQQKDVAKAKFKSGEMDLKEISTLLDVPQTILKPYLQSLK